MSVLRVTNFDFCATCCDIFLNEIKAALYIYYLFSGLVQKETIPLVSNTSKRSTDINHPVFHFSMYVFANIPYKKKKS